MQIGEDRFACVGHRTRSSAPCGGCALRIRLFPQGLPSHARFAGCPLTPALRVSLSGSRLGLPSPEEVNQFSAKVAIKLGRVSFDPDQSVAPAGASYARLADL